MKTDVLMAHFFKKIGQKGFFAGEECLTISASYRWKIDDQGNRTGHFEVFFLPIKELIRVPSSGENNPK